jgi:hypothetical protein
MPVTVFEFVPCNPKSKLKPGTTLQVRSRCMQGKNKREDSRRTKREKKKAAKECGDVVTQRVQEPVASGVPALWSTISDLALFRFAGTTIDSEATGLLSKAFEHNIADQSITPLDRCIDIECLESVSLGWLFSDITFLHSVLCASYAINDFMAPQWNGKPSRKTVFHLRETLSLLQVKMQDHNVHQDDSALQVIFNLALLAAVYGDWAAAAAHLEGMRKIVRMRGDMVFLCTRPTLHFKLDRLVSLSFSTCSRIKQSSIDLAWFLSSGKKPFFMRPIVTWNSVMSVPYLPLPPRLFQPSPDWDVRLVNVFRDLQYICLRINRNKLKYARHNPSAFQGGLTSIQSRLIYLSKFLKNPVEKLVHLAMMAFMTTTFKIPGRKVSYNWLLERLEDTYNEIGDGLIRLDQSLVLWALVTVAFTVAGAGTEWIKEAWKGTYPELDWAAVKDHLMRVMWIEMMHDEAGERVYHQLEDSRVFG